MIPVVVIQYCARERGRAFRVIKGHLERRCLGVLELGGLKQVRMCVIICFAGTGMSVFGTKEQPGGDPFDHRTRIVVFFVGTWGGQGRHASVWRNLSHGIKVQSIGRRRNCLHRIYNAFGRD